MSRTSMRSRVSAVLALTVTGIAAAGLAVTVAASGAGAADDNVGIAYRYFVGQGLAGYQSAAIVGNFMQESGVDPTRVQNDGGPGRGIAQWSVDGRWQNAITYARSTGRSVDELSTQLDFVWQELNGDFSSVLTGLRTSGSIEDATTLVATDYEVCGDCHTDERIANARNVLDNSAGDGSTTTLRAAFESNTSALFAYGSGGSVATRQGMAGGTSPAIARLANGTFETAFVANTGTLHLYGNSVNRDLGMRVAPNTSPAIARVGTGFVLAYQNTSTTLHVWDSRTGKDLDTHLGMMANTNPSVAGNGNAYQAVMQSNVGELFTFTSTVAGKGVGAHTRQGMAHNSSPSVAAFGSGYEAVFRANTGALVFWGAKNLTTTQAVASGTSPAITTIGANSYAAYQSTGNILMVVANTGGGATNTGQGMRAGTSPAITASGGMYETAFQSNTGVLVLHGGVVHANTRQGMNAASSPSLA